MIHKSLRNNKFLFLKICIKSLFSGLNLNHFLGFRYSIFSFLHSRLFELGDYSLSKKILKRQINSIILRKKIYILDDETSEEIVSINQLTERNNNFKNYSIHGFDVSKNVSFIYLYEIYKYLLFYGDLRAASWIRSIVSMKITHEIIQKNTNISTSVIFFSYLDLDFEILKKVFFHKVISRNLMQDYPQFYDFMKLLLPEENVVTHSINDSFHGYLNQRSIGVVGPGNASSFQGDTIDELDIIVRLNHSKNTKHNFNSHGSKTSISYYNHGAIIKRLSDVRKSISYIDWACFKDKQDKVHSTGSKHSPESRVYYLADDVFYKTSAMGVQNIVYDLLKNKANKISLFCFDFYCSKNPYQTDYPSKETREYFDNNNFLKSASQSLRFHDPFTNFCFIKLLTVANKVIASSSVDEVVSLSREDYALKLHDLYGEYDLSSR